MKKTYIIPTMHAVTISTLQLIAESMDVDKTNTIKNETEGGWIRAEHNSYDPWQDDWGE